ncbi:MAG: aminopeptidase [Thermodesulfobacteriales bacterium]|jgi:leucyl aminopeptidase (aminopeptidase T)|nr:MAG: aminopeptidase [Thermodesulfobacteriales bacterium]
MDQLKKAAEIALKDCMAVKKGERVLIITDEPARKIGYALWEGAKEMGAEAIFTEIITPRSNGEEPPEPIAELMKLVDVILIPTSKSLSHTDSRREASKAGVRIATLPGITEDMMTRTLNADYKKIAKKSDILAEIISKASNIRITSAKGTDINLAVKGRDGHSDTGLNHNPGDFSNLPAGEAYVAPMEGKSEGVIVFDGSMAGVGILKDEVINVKVEEGYATEITGGAGAEKLYSIMEPFGKLAFNLAELGIGTHDKALITGEVLEDEKVIGTVHIAFGDNKSMGGIIRVASHLDGVIMEPTVIVDGETIMDKGKFLIL